MTTMTDKKVETYQFSVADRDRARANHNFIKVEVDKDHPDVAVSRGNIVITGAESRWIKDKSAGLPERDWIVFSPKHRLAGSPKAIRFVLEKAWVGTDKVKENVIAALRECISMSNHMSTMRSTYERETSEYLAYKKTKRQQRSENFSIDDLSSITKVLSETCRTKHRTTSSKTEQKKRLQESLIEQHQRAKAQQREGRKLLLNVSKFGSTPSLNYGTIQSFGQKNTLEDYKNTHRDLRYINVDDVLYCCSNANAFEQAMTFLGLPSREEYIENFKSTEVTKRTRVKTPAKILKKSTSKQNTKKSTEKKIKEKST